MSETKKSKKDKDKGSGAGSGSSSSSGTDFMIQPEKTTPRIDTSR